MTDRASYRLLKEFYKRETMNKNQIDDFTGHAVDNAINQSLVFLSSNKFVEHVSLSYVPDGEGGFVDQEGYYRITIYGRAYVEQKRKDALLFLVPYAITTVVAIASLIVACIGLG